MSTQIVFVDGIGGRRFMRKPLIVFFKKHGFDVVCFDYAASYSALNTVKGRLASLLQSVSERGEYFVIGYSFGGILARAVLQEIGPNTSPPKRLVLLASPINPSRLCKRFSNWKLFRMMTGEFGAVAASEKTMAEIGLPNVPTSCIYGIWPWLGPLSLIGRNVRHDGMLTEEEVAPQLFLKAVAVNASHAFIPGNAEALRSILQCINASPVERQICA